MKRKCLILLSLCLIAALAFSAIAEGALATLYNAGTALLLGTDNVSLTGHAVFTYDGQRFKVFDGSYTQDGENSRMDVCLTTPLTNGGNYTGGYTVVANGTKVYEIRSDYPDEFLPQTNIASSSVLSNTDMTKLIANLGGTVVHLAESGLNDYVSVSRNGENVDYHLSLNQQNAPALLDKALTLLSKEIIDEYFYIFRYKVPYVTVDDRQQLIATIYEEMYGEKLDPTAGMPDETENPAASQRYEAARQAMFDYLEEVQKTTPYSAVIIHGKDKSQTTYDSFNAYLLERNQQTLHFEDYSPVLSNYVQQHPESQDPAADMRAYYKQILTDNQCAGMIIEHDGSYILCYNDNELSRLAPYTQSVTQRICAQLEEVSLHTAQINVRLDNRNRITAFSGQLSLNILDFVGRTHVLTIDFECSADDYGQSEVKLFDPKDYGIDDYYPDDGTGNG